MRNDRLVIFLNFGEEEKDITVNNGDPRWKFPSSFKIPPRTVDVDVNEFTPGLTSVRFGFKWDRDLWNGSKLSETNDIKFQSGNDILTIATYI